MITRHIGWYMTARQLDQSCLSCLRRLVAGPGKTESEVILRQMEDD